MCICVCVCVCVCVYTCVFVQQAGNTHASTLLATNIEPNAASCSCYCELCKASQLVAAVIKYKRVIVYIGVPLFVQKTLVPKEAFFVSFLLDLIIKPSVIRRKVLLLP